MKDLTLEMLCEINNRLVEITQVLLAQVRLKECKPEDKAKYLSRLMQMEKKQEGKYMSISYS